MTFLRAMLFPIVMIFGAMLVLNGCGVLEGVEDGVKNEWHKVFGKPGGRRPGNDPVDPRKEFLNCETECKIGHETENCLFINNSVSRPEYLTRAHEVANLFLKGGVYGKIEKDELMKLFDHQDEECDRGQIDVSKQYEFSNSGDEDCNRYIYRLRKGFASLDGNIYIMFYLPKEIKGRYDHRSEGYIIRFTRAGYRPEIIFSENDLNDDFGGEIGYIELNGSRAYLATKNACIASRL